MKNAIIENMYERQSIRQFTEAPVEKETIEELLSAAVQAATGGNTQGWHFTVLTSEEAKVSLNAAVRQGMLNLKLNENSYKSQISGQKAAQSENYCCYFHAPCWIILSAAKSFPNNMADCSLAAANIMHAAVSLGLGTCWVNQVRWTQDDPIVAEALRRINIAEDELVCVSLAVGAPAVKPTKPARKAPRADFF